MSNARRQLGNILLDHQVISEEQLNAALAYQEQHGCGLGDALIALDLCTEVEVARGLAEQNDIPFVDLEQTPPSTQALRLISREIAVEYGIIPVRVEGSRLLVAARNPYDFRLDAVIRKAVEMEVLMASAPDAQIKDLLSRYEELKYGQSAKSAVSAGSGRRAIPLPIPKRAPIPAARAVVPAGRPGGSNAVPAELLAESEQPAVVKKVNAIIAEAYRKRAREMFFEPDEEGLRIRCRIDGELHSMVTVPAHQKTPVLTRLKVVGGLTHNDSTDGAGHLRVDGKSVQLSSTVVPLVEGEVLVFRFASEEATVPALDQLGMEPEMLTELRRILAAGQGLLLVAGGAGTGRPTSLYSILKHLQEQGRLGFALESSFERKLTEFNQVQVGERSVSSFSAAMDLALKQNADVLVVGELPDRKSAELACRAAASGQLVIAGSLAPDALTAITRLLDLGLPGPELGSCLTGVLSQRLLRRVCEQCGKPARVPFHLDRAIKSHFAWPAGSAPKKGKGCKECHQIGARGCIGIFELVPVDEDLRYMLSERVAPSVLRELLRERRIRGLEEDAFQKVCQGAIAPSELPRLGLEVAATLETLAERDAESEVPEVPSFDDWVPTVDPMEEEPEPEDWDAVKNMASLLT